MPTSLVPIAFVRIASKNTINERFDTKLKDVVQ